MSTFVERLHPDRASLSVAEALAAFRPWEDPPPARPRVFLNMVASVDGRAAVDGRTDGLGDEADLEVLLGLRARADAVLVGTGTLRAEGYARLVRAPARRAAREAAGLHADPLAVLLSRGLDLPWDAGLFQAPEQPVLVYTGTDAPPEAARAVPAPVEIVRLAAPTPEATLRDLRARGVHALLCEGGPTLNRALLAAGLVDELFLTLAPLLAAGADPLTIVAGEALPTPARLELRWVLCHGSELLLRYAL